MAEVTRQESNRRLLLLAERLRSVPPEKFNFGIFSAVNLEGQPDVWCGTGGCAIGWASTMPEFKALGLTIGWSNYCVAPKCNGKEYSAAIAEVLGLSVAEADVLFYPLEEQVDDDDEEIPYASSRTCSPVEVAQHLEEFVRDHP